VNQRHTACIFGLGNVHFQGAFKIVEQGQQRPDSLGIGVFGDLGPFSFGPAPEVIELGGPAQQSILEVQFFFQQPVSLRNTVFRVGVYSIHNSSVKVQSCCETAKPLVPGFLEGDSHVENGGDHL